MDERDKPLFTIGEEITIKSLEEQDEPTRPARVRNMSGQGLDLITSSPIPLSAAISIKRDDALFLGEVVYCERGKDGYFLVVELQQILSGIADLQRNWIAADARAAAAGGTQ